MGLLTRAKIYFRFRRKQFASVGENCHYQTLHSKFHHESNIRLGAHVRVLDHAFFDALGGITIGDGTIVAPHCQILTANHDYQAAIIKTLPYNEGYEKKPVYIGRGCWIARNVTLLPGTHIGDGSIIGAGSVVSGNIPEFSVAAGNPAKVIKVRDANALRPLIESNQFFERLRSD